MASYITLPGTSGNYISTADVNLLDANDAHNQQASGKWSSYSTGGNAVGTVAQSQAVTPVFGDYVVAVPITTATGTGRAGVRRNASTAPLTAIPAAGDVTLSMWVYSDTAFSGTIYLEESTVANTSSSVSHTGSGWERFSQTHTFTGVGGIQIYFWVDNPASTFTFYIDAIMTEAASSASATFVPSIRIVGDLDMRAKVAMTDATPATAETLIGQRSGNSGYAMTIGTGGELVVYYGTGSGTRAETSSGLSLVAGAATVLRSYFDLSAGTWYHLQDGVQFDSSGSFSTTAGSPYAGPLAAGADSAGTSGNLDGDLYYIEVRDGIDGPVVARMDADDWVGI